MNILYYTGFLFYDSSEALNYDFYCYDIVNGKEVNPCFIKFNDIDEIKDLICAIDSNENVTLSKFESTKIIFDAFQQKELRLVLNSFIDRIVKIQSISFLYFQQIKPEKECYKIYLSSKPFYQHLIVNIEWCNEEGIFTMIIEDFFIKHFTNKNTLKESIKYLIEMIENCITDNSQFQMIINNVIVLNEYIKVNKDYCDYFGFVDSGNQAEPQFIGRIKTINFLNYLKLCDKLSETFNISLE